jgi:hypothetical protein
VISSRGTPSPVRPELVEGLSFFCVKMSKGEGFDNDGAPIALSGGQRSPIISPNGCLGNAHV